MTDSIRVSDIRQFAFCPRVIWHRVVMGQPTKETPKMKIGKEAEAALARLEKRRTLRRYGLERAIRRFSVALESTRLGLHGICDLVLDVPGTDEPWPKLARDVPGLRPVLRHIPPASYPVEVKTTRGGAGQHHILQLAAYAMLLEETGVPRVEQGFLLLLPSDKVHVVITGDRERAEVFGVIGRIQQMFENQRFPEPTRYRSFCPDCEYLNFCGDVL